MTEAVRQRAARIKMVIMDVDGVLTDASMYYSERGDELKRFNTRDGHGIGMLHQAGIVTALVTSERTAIVERRAAKLGIHEIHQGIKDKLPVVRDIIERHELLPDEVCYIGDDLGDLEALGYVGLAVAVSDAVGEVRRAAHYVTIRKGGDGAVREVCDLVLRSQGRHPADQLSSQPARASL